MPDEDLSARMAEIEKRFAKLEKQIFNFQVNAATKLTEALTVIKEFERAREAKVKEALEAMSKDVAEIRKHFTAMAEPPVTN